MNLRINDEAPDFTAQTTRGEIRFHDWIDDNWVVLFSHPKDFTPVCATELARVGALQEQFRARRCKVIGLSVDSVDDHQRWIKQIGEALGQPIDFPLIADENLDIAKRFGMLPAEESGHASGRGAADNATVRTVFVIGPDRKIKAMLVYPMTTGRSFDEVLRLLDSLQLGAEHNLATPADWKDGDRVVIPPSVDDATAKARFPEGWETVTSYLRLVKQPSR